LSLFFLGFTSATLSPNPNSIFLTPSSPSQMVEFVNSNSSDTGTYAVILSSSLSNIVGLNFNNLVYPSGRFITFTINSNAPPGTYQGSASFDSNNLPISVLVQNNTNVTEVPSDILVFPTNKVVTVQQGSSKSQNILVTVPSTYPRLITFQ